MAELLQQAPPVINEIALSKLLDIRSDAPPTRQQVIPKTHRT
jgi:hypothetical protein